MPQGPELIPRQVATVIITIVITIWAGSQIAAFLVDDYTPPEAIHAALVIVLGAVFGLRQEEKNAPPDPPDTVPHPVVPTDTGGLSAAEIRARMEEGGS